MNFTAISIKKTLFILFLTALPFLLSAQLFLDIDAGLTGLGRSEVEWADYDNDGDLDVMVSGLAQGDVRYTLIYRNDEGTFTDIQADLPGMKEVRADWGDYDNDGDLDLALAGNTENGDRSFIFKNNDGNFEDIEAGLPWVSTGDIKWGDYDNDSDLDLFVSGNWMGKLFRNDGGTFNDTGLDFGFWSSSSVAWGDHDNDGDLDILLMGDSGAGAKTKIFRNENGVFADTEITMGGLMAGTAHWVDMDNDGDLDISLSGYNDALEAQFYLYENEGGGAFDPYYGGIEGVALSAVDWGDLDSDGDLDLIISGKATGCGAFTSGIYRNDYPFFVKISSSFSTLFRSTVKWADYDNDGDLDFAISGLTASESPVTRIYRNTEGMNLFTENTAPEAPGSIEAVLDGNTVAFNWTRATDEETPGEGLYYNFRLGTTEGGCEIISCMSHLESGARKIIGTGNANQDTAWVIKSLDPGTYYYSIQSIDQCFAGSEFTPVQSFTITATSVDDLTEPGSITISPNPSTHFINISSGGSAKVIIADLKGSVIKNQAIQGNTRMDISDLRSGIYLIRIVNDEAAESLRLIKN